MPCLTSMKSERLRMAQQYPVAICRCSRPMTFAFRQNQPGSQGIKTVWFSNILSTPVLAKWHPRAALDWKLPACNVTWTRPHLAHAKKSSSRSVILYSPFWKTFECKSRSQTEAIQWQLPLINPYKVRMSRVCLDAKLLRVLKYVRLEPCGTVPGARKPHPKIGAAHFTNKSLMGATFASPEHTASNNYVQLLLLC